MPEPFHVRFNIEVPIEQAQERFVHRIANRVRKICGVLTGGWLDPVLNEAEATLGEPHSKFLETYDCQREFMERWIEIVDRDFLRCLNALEGLSKGLGASSLTSSVQELDEAITVTLAESEVDVGVSWQDGHFRKKGAELLDKELVNEPLRWLADPRYENALAPFKKGLSHLLEGTKDPQRFGDAVTDMYEALEAMAKIV